jgi:ethanolamine utilization cobalamin adenosyltransferase
MSNITLYEIAAEYRADLEKLAEMDLDEQAFADTLESLGGELQVKAQNTIAYTQHLEALSASIKEAEQRMAQRRKVIEKKVERIKDYVKEVMQANGIQRIECPHFVLSIAKNPPSVLIEDERQIPQDYFTSPPPPPPQIDKTLIKKAIQDGFDVPGAKLTQGVRLKIS